MAIPASKDSKLAMRGLDRPHIEGTAINSTRRSNCRRAPESNVLPNDSLDGLSPSGSVGTRSTAEHPDEPAITSCHCKRSYYYISTRQRAVNLYCGTDALRAQNTKKMKKKRIMHRHHRQGEIKRSDDWLTVLCSFKPLCDELESVMKYQITYKEQEKRHDGDGQCSTVGGKYFVLSPPAGTI
jgi:hypothetical protein